MNRFLLIIVLCASVILPSLGVAQGRLIDKYAQSEAFKAIATPVLNEVAVQGGAQGFAWGYDTVEEAMDAALAYCRAQLLAGPRVVQCEIVRLGEIPIFKKHELPMIALQYETLVLGNLRAELAHTGERELITRLSTIYQKIGRYADSEELLYDLAVGGEHLAQNALAYHWAELKTRLDEALVLVDSAIEQDGKFFSYHDTRALVLARLERWEEAERSSRLAVEFEEHPIALDHLGDILWLRGKKEAARIQWERAVTASSNILFVRRVKSKIQTGMIGDIVFE